MGFIIFCCFLGCNVISAIALLIWANYFSYTEFVYHSYDDFAQDQVFKGRVESYRREYSSGRIKLYTKRIPNPSHHS